MRAAALVLMMMVRCRALVPRGGDALARRVTRPAGSPHASRLQPQRQRRQRELHAAAEEVDAEQTAGLATALERIRNEVAAAAVASGRDAAAVELVAVSKTKPIELLQAAYDAGQRVFGENYAQVMNRSAQTGRAVWFALTLSLARRDPGCRCRGARVVDCCFGVLGPPLRFASTRCIAPYHHRSRRTGAH